MASAQQSVNFYVGGFVPRGHDARDNDDVLVERRVLNDRVSRLQYRGLQRRHFRRRMARRTWRHVEGGLGLGFYQRTVPTVYARLRQHQRQPRFEQDLKLRIVPFTATVRFLPLGHTRRDPAVHRRRRRRLRLALQRNRAVRGLPEQHLQRQLRRQRRRVGPVILGGVRVPVGMAASASKCGISRRRGSAGRPGICRHDDRSGRVNYLFTVNFRF